LVIADVLVAVVVDAVNEKQGAIIVEAGDESADALAQPRSSVFGDEPHIGRAEFQTANEVERGRDQRGHALLPNRAPKRNEFGQRLLTHGAPPWRSSRHPGSDAARTGSAGSAPGLRR